MHAPSLQDPPLRHGYKQRCLRVRHSLFIKVYPRRQRHTFGLTHTEFVMHPPLQIAGIKENRIFSSFFYDISYLFFGLTVLARGTFEARQTLAAFPSQASSSVLTTRHTLNVSTPVRRQNVRFWRSFTAKNA